MGTSIAKQDRIGARVPHEVYETLCRAAELTGSTVNQFLVQAALKEAQEVIERQEEMCIRERFELSLNPLTLTCSHASPASGPCRRSPTTKL